MNRTLIFGLAACLLGGLALGASAMSASKAEPQLAHMVFFTLKDSTPAARESFAASCRKYLGGHDGVAYFSVGAIAEDVTEPVSVRDFDVALHVVFDTKANRDAYLKHPRHDAFVKENSSVWSKVRVFDSYVPAK